MSIGKWREQAKTYGGKSEKKKNKIGTPGAPSTGRSCRVVGGRLSAATTKDKCQSLRNLTPKIQHIPIVVVDPKLPHSVREVFNRIDDLNLALQAVPQFIHLGRSIELEVERSGKLRLLKWQMGIGHRQHEFYAVFLHAGPAIGLSCALKAKDIALKPDAQ